MAIRQVAHLVVEEDPDDGCHHAQHIGERDRVAQQEKRDADDHDPLGRICHGVAERADQTEHAEGDDVLSEVAETADEQQNDGSRPSRHVPLRGKHVTFGRCSGSDDKVESSRQKGVTTHQIIIHEKDGKVNQHPGGQHEYYSIEAQNVEKPQVVDVCVTQHL